MPNSTQKSRKRQPSSSRSSSSSKSKGKSSSRPSPPPLQKRAEATLTKLDKQDPGLKQLLKDAHGYAVFPSVGKAALVVGGSYGRGVVFEQGKLIGYATISQMTLGVQIGGDTFTEILVFHDEDQLERFKRGHMAFAANASAVMVKAAAAGTSDFKGVTALAYSSGGMLLELSLGGQKFTFKPLGAGGEDEPGGKGGGKSRRKGGGEASQSDADDGAAQGDGIFGRAMGGMAKVTDMAKEHPVAATVLGAGLTTGLAFLLVRTMRQSIGSLGSLAGAGEDSDGEDADYDDEEDEDTSAQDRSDDSQDDDEGDDEDQDESEDGGGSRRRSRRRSRSRA